MVVGSEWRLYSTRPHLTAPIEGRLDGDGGMARAVEPQGRPVTGVGGVAGKDPGQVVCHTRRGVLFREKRMTCSLLNYSFIVAIFGDFFLIVQLLSHKMLSF